MDKAIALLDQIIEKNIYDDNKDRKEKGGESWNIFHLKLLRNLIIEEIKK